MYYPAFIVNIMIIIVIYGFRLFTFQLFSPILYIVTMAKINFF